MTATDAARTILQDAFDRVREQVTTVADGLSVQDAGWRPDPEANSIGWLLWHLARVQDDHLAGLTGAEQVWATGGWQQRLDLPFPPGDIGFGHTSEQVSQLVADPAVLVDYQQAVHQATLDYLGSITPEELARVVDTRWDPPVTASVRLVSVINDCTQHIGQAAYVKGMLDRRD